MSDIRSKRPPQRAIAEAVEAVTRRAAAAAPEAVAMPAAEAVPAATTRPLPPPRAISRLGLADWFDLFDAAQTALVHGAEAWADEWTGLMRSEVAVAADAATAILSADTLSDAIDANARLARRSFDTMLAGSAKLSKIGARIAAEAWQPLAGSVVTSG